MCEVIVFFFSSRRRHTRYWRDWSSDVCSSDLGGRVAVVWHVTRESGTPFLRDHADLMSAYISGSGAGGAEDARAMTRAFFGDGPGGQRGYEAATFPYHQGLDFEGFKGLVLSSSSVPAPGQPGSEEMLRGVEEVFRDHESGGKITIDRKSTRLNSSHANISYAVFCLKKKKIRSAH